ncbi:MAG: hypothetical protein D3908_09495 [Candidatus Electrothrix sp. AUS4]|nr:hypothetical protein [Candidatus Electrothrix sp. AUS4]
MYSSILKMKSCGIKKERSELKEQHSIFKKYRLFFISHLSNLKMERREEKMEHHILRKEWSYLKKHLSFFASHHIILYSHVFVFKTERLMLKKDSPIFLTRFPCLHIRKEKMEKHSLLLFKGQM